jgi:iron(III) transport system ATP-binding protein
MSHLSIERLSVSYPGAARATVEGLSFQLAKGAIGCLLGASGCGKTTVLRALAGFLKPTQGTIHLAGKRLADASGSIAPEARNIGMVFQDFALFPHLTVSGNIAFGLGKLPAARRGERVAQMLALTNLQAEEKRYPHELSGGQQQRVALARALAREPELMLLDEPFSALDAGLRVATRRAVAKVLNQAGVTTILVTHDQAEALSFADQVAVMRGGKLAQIGNPFVVYTRPADRATAEFLGDAVILDAWLEGSLATCSLGAIPVRRPPAQGRVQLMLRPEQIRIAEDAAIRGVVVDTDYFGPETTVRLKLSVPPQLASSPDHRYPGGGEIITIRHWNASIARPGMELCLRVVGEGVAFPIDD